MDIPKNSRQRIAKEIEFVSNRMKRDNDPLRQLYSFSGIYGVVQSVLNETWDADLTLAHSVLRTTHATIAERWGALAQGRERGVDVPPGLMDVLVQITSDLGNAVKTSDDGQLHEALARMAALTYVTTGNGYYLYLKGIAKIPGLEAPANQ